MEDWKEYKIDDLCGFQNGFAFKSSDFCSDGKYRVVKIKELKAGQVKFFEDSSFVNCLDSSVIDKYSIKKNDVLFALTGDPVNKPNPQSWVGRVSIYNQEEESLLNQRVCKAMPKEGLDSFFLYYYFRQNDVFYALASKATGSASQANISTKTIGDIHIRIPSLIEQKRIVNILKSLDDKIECNRRINENLEQQAQALFKSWFVDFEPFKDQPFIESELGMIPHGCEWKSLSEIADYVNGLAMQKYRPIDGEEGLPVLKIKELGQGGFDDSSEMCSPSLIGEKYIITDGDIIFSWSGTLMVKIWCGGKCGLNQHLFVVIPNDFPRWFVYHWTKYHLNNFIRIAKDKAVTMGHIKRGELDKAKVVIPDSLNLQRIDAVMQPIFEQIISNELESRRLAELRDTLLPRLMSGEIKVEDATL